MNEKFFDLKKEKQDRIINGALKVFAKLGYKYGSTDEIVKEAAISKGLLFHYFRSKLGLFVFLYEYSIRYYILELEQFVNKDELNLFEIQIQMEKARFDIQKIYPYMVQFIEKANKEDSLEILTEIEEKKHAFHEKLQEIYKQVTWDYIYMGDEEAKEFLLSYIDGYYKRNMDDSGLLNREIFNCVTKGIKQMQFFLELEKNK
ncbi:MAG: TetR/AcrR family transcriptional regulator [Lachnospiraceae bacterium]